MRQNPPLDPPDIADIPWYGAGRSLPASRFIPGRSPHPDLNRQTGRIARSSPAVHAPWTPEQWPTLQAYLRGIDLFNRWYFWEAHEAWEPLWRAHHPQSDPARFIQGLISSAAALLKLRMGQSRSARTLSTAACERLISFHGLWMGLMVEEFRSEIERHVTLIDAGAAQVSSPTTPRIRLTHLT
jgi:hypothetical protein